MSTTITTIDAATLTSYYQAKAGVLTSSGSSASSSSSTSTKAPTPPWSSTSTATPQSALVTAALQGTRFINPTSAQLDIPGATAAQSTDYKNLFALYQGLSALQGIATAASASNVSAATMATYSTRFTAGMTEVQNYLASSPFSEFTVAQGSVSTSMQSTIPMEKETDTYQTGAVYTGDLNDAVPAFAGQTQFSMTLTKPSGSQVTVNFDLSEMGDETRSMPNVVNYLNSKLQSAGVYTRFANVRIPATPTTVKEGDTSVTLPAGKDSFALEIKGVSTEVPTFSAPDAAPGVFITSTSGTTAAQATTDQPADATQQIAKFNGSQDTDTESDGTTKVLGRTLPSDVSSVQATATGPDGSLYVLANVTGSTTDGQTIKGTQDVALIKYDSEGNIQYTRTLGANTTATGTAIAVSADGKSVAITGTTPDVLDGAGGTPSSDSTLTNTFTSVFTSAGEESWTTERTASAGTTPTAVSFGADGSVYVVGKTTGSIQGATGNGSSDGYLQAYNSKGTSTYNATMGTAGADAARGVSADANGVVVAAVENGHAVLQRYDFDANGKLQVGASRDLGDLQGGDIAGLGRAADGSLIVAGSTHNGALDAGTVQNASDGGRDIFVATVGSDLTASSSDTVTYAGLNADASTSAMTVSGGQVYVTGTLNQGDGNTLGYGAAIDASTGALGWQDTIKGADSKDAPTSIAVAQSGASTLDRLGLPTAINYNVSNTLVANTSVRAGDQFYVRSGTGSAVPITIEATDTLDTLATKINRALGFTAKATVVSTSTGKELNIVPANSRTSIQIEAGTGGRDALSALGLSEGTIMDDDASSSSSSSSSSTSTSTTSSSSASSSATTDAKTYGLKLPSTLGIGSASQAKNTAVILGSAMTQLQLAYSDLAFPTTSSSSSSSSASGTVPQYLTDEISNYQLALARLTGGSSSSSSLTVASLL